MRAVWKFPLPNWSDVVKIPRGAKPVHFDLQDRLPTLWMEVDTEAVAILRRVLVVATGFPIPDGHSHTGTVIDGPFVWHVYIEDEVSS